MGVAARVRADIFNNATSGFNNTTSGNRRELQGYLAHKKYSPPRTLQ